LSITSSAASRSNIFKFQRKKERIECEYNNFENGERLERIEKCVCASKHGIIKSMPFFEYSQNGIGFLSAKS
jgi:hypothetical protein